MLRLKPVYLVILILFCCGMGCRREDDKGIEPVFGMLGSWQVDSMKVAKPGEEPQMMVKNRDGAGFFFGQDSAEFYLFEQKEYSGVYNFNHNNRVLLLDVNQDSKTDTLQVYPGEAYASCTIQGMVSVNTGLGRDEEQTWYYYLRRP